MGGWEEAECRGGEEVCAGLKGWAGEGPETRTSRQHRPRGRRGASAESACRCWSARRARGLWYLFTCRDHETEEWRRVMNKGVMIVATVVSSLGLVCYQSFAVRQVESRTVHVGEVLQPAEVKALAAEIGAKVARLENVPALAEVDGAAMPAAPTIRRGAFVTAPSSPAKSGKAKAGSRVSSSSAKKKEAKAPAVQKRRTGSVFSSQSAAMRRELSRNFYKKTDFGFNGRVRKSAKGKRVGVQRN
jgi:hypothetical protein